MIPEFNIQEGIAEEWSKAYSAKSELLTYSTRTENIDFPVDNWLYGVARVRKNERSGEYYDPGRNIWNAGI